MRRLNKSKSHRKETPLSTFQNAISQAISENKKAISLIKNIFATTFNNEVDMYQSWMNTMDGDLNEELNSAMTLAFIGSPNSGKSSIVSALLKPDLELPCSDERNSSNIVRIVYSKESYIKTVQTGKWRILSSEDAHYLSTYSENLPDTKRQNILYKFIHHHEEKMLKKFKLTEETMDNLINNSDNKKDLDSTIIIEIGIPSQLLKSGLQIIDCPGLSDRITSNIHLQIVRDLHPSLICYCYDYNKGFRMEDVRHPPSQ